MKKLLPLCLVPILVSSCSTPATRQPQVARRPSFVESVTPLPDGTKEIVVFAKFTFAAGSREVKSTNLPELLEKAASVECNGGPHTATPEGNGQIGSGKDGALKLSLKGIVRCG